MSVQRLDTEGGIMPEWLEKERQRKYHEVAQIFALMEGNEFEQLKNDIGENGLLEDIWLHPDGSIIDGRNRHRACIETETEPRFRTWNSNGSLVEFVISRNIRRRDLNSSQRAVLSLDVLPLLKDEAAQRQGQRTDLLSFSQNLPELIPESETGESREKAAALFNTNGKYISYANKLQKHAPYLLPPVRAGKKSILQAMREYTKQCREEIPPLPSQEFRVIYADPPWQYGNKGLDDYGHAERHYPTMTISELCGVGDDIKLRTEENAVLFLWVTSPFLEDSFKIINAWGFKYKTSFVWDKVKHNFGHYNSVRHEFLLVCTKGSCTPDVQKLFDSVQTIERTDVHSRKPEEFRSIIDTIYPYGKRIELFSRTEADGWEGWGNEPG